MPACQPRPTIAMLQSRNTTVRSVPRWTREPQDGGAVQWRIYQGHRFGGVLLMVFDAPAQTERHVVAAKLGEIRRVLRGQDKVQGAAVAASTPAPIEPDPIPAPALPQGSLF